MQAYIRPSDYRQLRGPASPLIAYILPWMIVLIGQQMALCSIIKPVYSVFYLIVIGNIFSSILIAFTIQTFFPQKLDSANLTNLTISKGFKRITFSLILFYLISQVLQIIYFKGFPLYWLLAGIPKYYIDFGFSSFNGLLNAIYLLVTTLLYLIYLKERKFKYLSLIIFLLTIPILLICRQLLMSVFLQIACCMLLYKPKSIKKIMITFVCLLMVFILVGNLRTGVEHLTSILGPQDYIPKSLYSLLWIYAYVVTPFNNINASMDVITPLGQPFHEISSLLPSIFRSPSLIGEGGDSGFSLIHQEMNVCSFYLAPLLDFGPWYAFFFMAGFQVFLFLSYRRALRENSWLAIVEYAILYMVMILSIFSNLLLFLPVVAQLVIIKITKWQIYRRQGIVVVANNRYESNL